MFYFHSSIENFSFVSFPTLLRSFNSLIGINIIYWFLSLRFHSDACFAHILRVYLRLFSYLIYILGVVFVFILGLFLLSFFSKYWIATKMAAIPPNWTNDNRFLVSSSTLCRSFLQITARTETDIKICLFVIYTDTDTHLHGYAYICVDWKI